MAERLKELKEFREVDVDFISNNFDIIGKILRYDRAIIVDAVRKIEEAGKIHILSIDDIQSYESRFTGTHDLDLITCIRIGYDVFGDEMPRDLKIVAIEVEDVRLGYGCSEKVEEAIPKVVDIVKALLLDHIF